MTVHMETARGTYDEADLAAAFDRAQLLLNKGVVWVRLWPAGDRNMPLVLTRTNIADMRTVWL